MLKRISFYLEENDYDKLKELADDMTVLRGIDTSVNDLAKSYVIKTING